MILVWPNEWYRFTSSSFTLQARNLYSPHTWTGGTGVSAGAWLWAGELTLSPQQWDEYGQSMSAFFSMLRGRLGKMRICDPMRRIPQRDRLIVSSGQTFSDGTNFSDGTKFIEGLLPDFVTLDGAVSRGGTHLVLAGLPASEAACLRRGDTIEIRPNGIPSETSSLYEIQFNAPTDADGKTGVVITPPLKTDCAAGDMVVLRNPMGVFRLAGDDKANLNVSLPGLTSVGFSLIEAII